jgi:hypothetical protein
LVIFKRMKEMKLSRRQFIYVFLYLLILVLAFVIIHEGAHILAALALGARFDELKLGFYGVNPSVTLPEYFIGTRQTLVSYAGGLAAGMILLLFYLLYWVRRYHSTPTFFYWSLGLVTVTFSGAQLAMGYLEGRYHAAYIIGAGSLFSLTDIVTYGWALSAIIFHFALCPLHRMKIASQ